MALTYTCCCINPLLLGHDFCPLLFKFLVFAIKPSALKPALLLLLPLRSKETLASASFFLLLPSRSLGIEKMVSRCVRVLCFRGFFAPSSFCTTAKHNRVETQIMACVRAFFEGSCSPLNSQLSWHEQHTKEEKFWVLRTDGRPTMAKAYLFFFCISFVRSSNLRCPEGASCWSLLLKMRAVDRVMRKSYW